MRCNELETRLFDAALKSSNLSTVILAFLTITLDHLGLPICLFPNLKII